MDQTCSVLSGCYIFKNRLFEYTQRLGIQAPVYDTIKEGPPQEFCFKCTVTVANIRYDSLPGFSNRKIAEQSAAEIALMELAKSGEKNVSINTPLYESGLCKQLLQQYSCKMSYALPSYVSQQSVGPDKSGFTCTVNIGGNQYTGDAARSKKAAEINAAKVALLAIQSDTVTLNGHSQYVVIPCKRERTNLESTNNKTTSLKPKKVHMKKRSKGKFPDHVVDELNDLLAGKGVANTQYSAGSGAAAVHEEPNANCDGEVVRPESSDVNLKSPQTFRIVSEIQIKDLLSLAEEIRKFCNAGLAAPMTTASTTQVHLSEGEGSVTQGRLL